MEEAGSLNETVDEVLDEMNSTYLMEEMSSMLEKMRVFDLTSCGLTAQNEHRSDQVSILSKFLYLQYIALFIVAKQLHIHHS